MKKGIYLSVISLFFLIISCGCQSSNESVPRSKDDKIVSQNEDKGISIRKLYAEELRKTMKSQGEYFGFYSTVQVVGPAADTMKIEFLGPQNKRREFSFILEREKVRSTCNDLGFTDLEVRGL